MAATRIIVMPDAVIPPSFFVGRVGRIISAAARHAPEGHDTIAVTSGRRVGSSGRHGTDDAVDLDTLTQIPKALGELWAAKVQADVGWDYDVIWHGPRWHLHGEDEEEKHRTAWTAGQSQRIALLQA